MSTKLFTILLFIVSSFFARSQNKPGDSILNEVKTLQLENRQLRVDYGKLKSSVTILEKKQTEFQSDFEKQSKSIENQNKEFSGTIDTVNRNSIQKFSSLDDKLKSNFLYGIIALLFVSLLSAIAYIFLGKNFRTGKSQLESQISEAKKVLEEEGIKLDLKLVEILETQLKLLQNWATNSTDNNAVDHSLAIKVADEILRINKNLSNMDSGIKGLKQLSASVKRIEDNFSANGYDMPELLNKPFDPRMKMIVTNSIPDENLKTGDEIITRIIKPQVNFRGVMIQAAQVEVSVGQI